MGLIMTQNDFGQLEATLIAQYHCTLKNIPGASYRIIVNSEECELGELDAEGNVTIDYNPNPNAHTYYGWADLINNGSFGTRWDAFNDQMRYLTASVDKMNAYFECMKNEIPVNGYPELSVNISKDPGNMYFIKVVVTCEFPQKEKRVYTKNLYTKWNDYSGDARIIEDFVNETNKTYAAMLK